MDAKCIAITAAAGSALVVVACVLSAAVLFNDINSLYDEVLGELQDFQGLANDAWRGINVVSHRRPALAGERAVDSFTDLVLRRRRSTTCQCAPPTRKCRPGPAGAKGETGPPGEPGPAGKDGNDGLPGEDRHTRHPILRNCIRCPPGAPGAAGPEGLAGPPGVGGFPGVGGYDGEDGHPGARGPPGEQGPPGAPGIIGQPGYAGREGRRATSPAGPKGPPGQPGRRGHQGSPGESPPPAPRGEPGVPGRPGQPGVPGRHGRDGKTGRAGSPGRDQGYCACPKSENAADVELTRRPVVRARPSAVPPTQYSAKVVSVDSGDQVSAPEEAEVSTDDTLVPFVPHVLVHSKALDQRTRLGPNVKRIRLQ